MPGSAITVVESQIAPRMNRLPVTRDHRRFLWIIAAGLGMGLYDVFMSGYVGAAMVNTNFMAAGQLTWFLVWTFAGSFVGVNLVGWLGDRFGRRSMFLWSLVGYAVLTLVGTFVTSVDAMYAVRFLAGMGIGAEFIIVDTFVGEMIPSRQRGRFMLYAWTIGNISLPFVALLSYVIIPATPLGLAGWRWIFLVGGVLGLLVWFLRLRLPESPRWLEVHNRVDEAEVIVARMEKRAEEETGKPLPSPESVQVQKADKVPLGEIFRRPYGGRVLMIIGLYVFSGIGYFGFASWVPTLLVSEGITLTHALFYSFLTVVISPLGTLVGSLLAERLSRRWTLAILALVVAAAGLGFGFSRSAVLIVLFGATVAFINQWLTPVIHIFQVEMFPTRIRATAGGFVYSWSRATAALSAPIVAGLLALGGVSLVFVGVTVLLIFVTLEMVLFGRTTNSLALEVTSTEVG